MILFRTITLVITRFPASDEHTTTLYNTQNTSALVKSTHQTESLHLSPQEAATGPAGVSHNDTRGCYATSDHILWPIPHEIPNPQNNNQTYIQHCPIATNRRTVCCYCFCIFSSSDIHHGSMLKVITFGRTAPADRQ